MSDPQLNDDSGLEEIVVLFDEDVTSVASEMRVGEFESLVNQAATLEEFAASQVKAAFGVVGAGLMLRGVVLFLLKVNEEGYVDSGFNLPLRYLVNHAGDGPDLGHGPLKYAARGRCAVPWHSLNLWDVSEDVDADRHPAYLMQKAVWRNRLKLSPRAKHMPQQAEDALPELLPNEQRQLEERLTEAFGEQGRVSLEQLIRQYNHRVREVAERYRCDVAQQQQSYLDQIRAARNEIQKLKSALRQEQERSRRLQALLRGDP